MIAFVADDLLCTILVVREIGSMQKPTTGNFGVQARTPPELIISSLLSLTLNIYNRVNLDNPDEFSVSVPFHSVQARSVPSHSLADSKNRQLLADAIMVNRTLLEN